MFGVACFTAGPHALFFIKSNGSQVVLHDPDDQFLRILSGDMFEHGSEQLGATAAVCHFRGDIQADQFPAAGFFTADVGDISNRHGFVDRHEIVAIGVFDDLLPGIKKVIQGQLIDLLLGNF